MTTSRQETAEKLLDYLHHKITGANLVDWAETVMMDGEFDEKDAETVRDIVARLGLSDVRAFGLTWENCEGFLSKLGYKVSLTVAESGPAYG